MSDITIFEHPEFGKVRAVYVDGEPWLVGKDVAVALGYSNPRDALARHVDAEDRNTVAFHDGTSGNPNQTIINESGLYSLVLSSKLPGAKKFRRWVTAEVLPSIRKHGGYIAGQESITDEELMARALLVADSKIKERDRLIEQQSQQIEAMRPAQVFSAAVTASKQSCLIGELAKILKQNGYPTGQNRLFDWLRSNGYLIRRQGTDYNMPTQRAMELGLFEIKETAITHADGHTTVSRTPKVTGKGQQYFINKFLA